MRKFGLFLCLSLLFAFTGCSDSDDVEEQGGTVLAKPSVAVTTTTSSSFKVAWDAVPNAESYKYRLSQENETGDELVVQPENSTSATALAFGDLDPKTKYILRVKAVAAAPKDPEYTPPKAKTLTYNGQAQALITGGTVKEGGTMLYRLGATGEYSENIPTATNAGEYTVYYKVKGSGGYNDTAEQSIPVHINLSLIHI